MPVIEKAIETADLMLGTDKSRGYCLEMICPDFLAGAIWILGIQNAVVLNDAILQIPSGSAAPGISCSGDRAGQEAPPG